MTDADAEQNVRKTYTTTYDEAGRVATAGDGVNDLIEDHGQGWVRRMLDNNADDTIEESGMSVQP